MQFVLLFNLHTSDSVWRKTDYIVHVLVFPPPHRRGCCAWLPLAGAWEAQRASICPQFHTWGRQLPVATTSCGHQCRACHFLLFPPELRFIANTFSANVEATPEETKQVHSVIEDLVQCQLNPKKCFRWPKRRLDVRRRRRRSARVADRQLLCLWPVRPGFCWAASSISTTSAGVFRLHF